MEPLLASFDAAFLGCGMHPLMDPSKQGELWTDDDHEIYETYDRIFDCRGHGWVNLQSIHINLPFANDTEFGKLHAAVRLVLPLIPALAASSPLVEGQLTELDDNRLAFYLKNQSRIPEITGPLIPESVWTRAAYEAEILQGSYLAISACDPQRLLQEEWLNSRGAIARFDRHAIEIRLLDKQESLTADFALITAVIAVVKALYDEQWSTFTEQSLMSTEGLRKIFDQQLQHRSDQPIADVDYLQLFGMTEPCSAKDMWRKLQSDVSQSSDLPSQFFQDLSVILDEGNFSQRMRRHLPAQPTRQDIIAQYRRLPDLSRTGGFYR